MLDYNSILAECGFGSLQSQEIIKKLANLEEKYSNEELASIYNYCLLNVNDIPMLVQIIKLSDSHRAASTLAVLLEILREKKDV